MSQGAVVLIGLMLSTVLPASAQPAAEGPPVIDVHIHTPMGPGPVEDLAALLQERLRTVEGLNVRYAVLTGVPDLLFAWRSEVEDRIGVLPALLFPCVNGLAVMWGRPCFESGEDWPELGRLRQDVEAGRIGALGEITTQFLGLTPSDPALEPYLALAEEYDLPVFIHMGPGIPGTNQGGAFDDLPVPEYRATAGNPLGLEEALMRHPDLRVAVMHAGWPLADEMVLRRLVEAGFGDRVLFGSDGSLEEGIDAVMEAEYLTEQQKRDILCQNAARFLRLDEGVCAPRRP